MPHDVALIATIAIGRLFWILAHRLGLPPLAVIWWQLAAPARLGGTALIVSPCSSDLIARSSSARSLYCTLPRARRSRLNASSGPAPNKADSVYFISSGQVEVSVAGHVDASMPFNRLA